MAKIKIVSDTFDICERIKKIDKYYYVVYDTIKKVYEVHNSRQISNTFCITIGKRLDMRALSKLMLSSISNLDKIISDMTKHNEKLEQENSRKVKDMVTWRAQELYNYAMRNSVDDFGDAYSTSWV